MVGSPVAGVVVTLVALTKGAPMGIATGAFYIVYPLRRGLPVEPRGS